MDRQAIINRIASELEANRHDVKHILVNGGWLDLLEAAENITDHHGKHNKARREDYYCLIPEKTVYNLREKVAKAKGVD